MAAKASSINEVKDYNTKLVLSSLRKVNYATKNDMAQMTALSIATCNTILNELAQTNQAIVLESSNASTGRPPKLYQFNTNYTHICCIYIQSEGEKRTIYSSILDLLGNPIQINQTVYNYVDGNIILNTLEQLITQDSLINKISIGLEGIIIDGCPTNTGIPELQNCPVKKIVTERFHMETHCNNDMNMTALGLYQSFCPDSPDPFCAIALFQNHCPGAGIIIHKRLLKGFSHFAGEVGFLRDPIHSFWDHMETHYDEVFESVVRVVTSIITVINPRYIFFTGMNATPQLLSDVQEECARLLPKRNLPEFHYEKDISKYYTAGLFQEVIDF